MTKRFRVYFEEHARIERIVHADTAKEALARCQTEFIGTDKPTESDFKVRCDTSEWKIENLGKVDKT